MTTTTCVLLCRTFTSFGHSLSSHSCRPRNTQDPCYILAFASLALPVSSYALSDAVSTSCVALQGRCAAVLMFHTQLALLPAMETEGLELDLMMDDPYGEGVEGPGGASTELVSATVGNSYVVNLAKMGVKKVQMAVPVLGCTTHIALSVVALQANKIS